MKPSRLGKIELLDDHDAAYAEDYYASGQSAPVRDRSSEFDYRGWSDADLENEERWARYHVESGLRRTEIHRLRAIHQEQERRRPEAQS